MSPGNRPSLKGSLPARETIAPTATSANPATIRSFPKPTIPVYRRQEGHYLFGESDPQTGIEGTLIPGSTSLLGESVGVV